jgi:FkbM family methyltransferase
MRGLSFTIEGRPLAAYRVLGLQGFTRMLASKLQTSKGAQNIEVIPPGFAHSVRLRGGTSDIATFMQIFEDREYELEGLTGVRTIIDAGANIGLSAIYFAHRYPGARIVALEPEESNFDLLAHNVRPYSSVLPIEAALWSSNGTIDLVDPGAGKWGFQVREAVEAQHARTAQRTRAMTVSKVMEEAQFNHVDILKIDIEGAEKELFAASKEWIDKVDVLMVELHDRFKAGCSRSFYNATNAFGAEWHRGEHVFLKRTAATCTPEVSARQSLTH